MRGRENKLSGVALDSRDRSRDKLEARRRRERKSRKRRRELEKLERGLLAGRHPVQECLRVLTGIQNGI